MKNALSNCRPGPYPWPEPRRRPWPQPGPRPAPKYWPKRTTGMTIIIGLIGKDSIILACDSQTTYGAHTKRLNAKKISVVKFKNSEALVAESGAADLSSRVVEIFRRNAKNESLTDSDTVMRVAESSVREVRNHLVDLNKGCNFSEQGWKDYFRYENGFELLVAFYFQKRPYLYKINIEFCVPIPVTSHYAAIGVGDTMAYHFLDELADPEMLVKNALATSIYVIEKVKQNVEGCGGLAQAAMVRYLSETEINQSTVLHQMGKFPLPYSKTYIIPPEDINRYVKRFADFDLQNKQARNQKILEMISMVDTEFMQEIDADMENADNYEAELKQAN
jgi:20S proteasome alpha/beta subunit